MRQLKVYGWNSFPREFKGKQCRCIMAAPSRRKVAELCDCSDYYLAGYSSITGNKEEIELAMANPLQKFARPVNNSEAYIKVSNR